MTRERLRMRNVWKEMIRRCTDMGCKSFERYGALGVMVCDEWLLSFEKFFEDMGTRPSPEHSIDRIDGNAPYQRSNCRWATRSEQARNQRRARILEHKGESLNMVEWGNRTGLGSQTIYQRLKKGWSVDRALTAPKVKRSPRKRAA